MTTHALDELVASEERPVDLVAPGHGSPLLDPAVTIEKITLGLRLSAGKAIR